MRFLPLDTNSDHLGLTPISLRVKLTCYKSQEEMNTIGHLLVLIPLLIFWNARPVTKQAGPGILSPGQGDALQGVVTIKGTSYVSGFTWSELAFAYSEDTTDTWFMIAASSQAVVQDVLATWDTTTITDGNYVLRLRVHLSDGGQLDFMLPSLRVRNYTAIETPTPSPTAVITLTPMAMTPTVRTPVPVKPTSTPTRTLTPTMIPTPTNLPGNSAIITTFDLTKSIAFGGAAAILFLLVLSLYLKLRRL
jgi:hypothetical protein